MESPSLRVFPSGSNAIQFNGRPNAVSYYLESSTGLQSLPDGWTVVTNEPVVFGHDFSVTVEKDRASEILSVCGSFDGSQDIQIPLIPPQRERALEPGPPPVFLSEFTLTGHNDASVAHIPVEAEISGI